MVADYWFRGLWKNSKKHEVTCEQTHIGVLAFEVAILMSKLVHLWYSLSDRQVVKTREEIMSLIGIGKLVSDDDNYIVDLICAEMIKNLKHVAKAVSRLAKKCNDPCLKSFERTFDDLIKIGADPYEWQYSRKKMGRKVKKMERFIMVDANLHQEVEILAELEQFMRKTKSNNDTDGAALIQNEKKVSRKHVEVKHLKEISLWNRTYDYIVRLLARSLFTTVGRVGHVFGFNHVIDMDIREFNTFDTDYIYRSQSVSTLLQYTDFPSDIRIPRYSSGPLESMHTKSGPLSKKNRTTNFHSGPLGNSITSSSPKSGKHKSTISYSGPLEKSITKSTPTARASKSGLKLWKTRDSLFTLEKKGAHAKASKLPTVGTFKGCMISGNNSVKNCHVNSDVNSGTQTGAGDVSLDCRAHHNLLQSDPSMFSSKSKPSNTPPETLGSAALALHYANVIIVIEKLVGSPHLIGQDARDDLYNMLPASVRAALRSKLKPVTKSVASSVYDTDLAQEWTEAMSGILEWLAPLAHNMIRWQSERSYEHQNLLSKTNILLVQTLYYANQEKTEATITELLVGLNYVWRHDRELNAKALMECGSSKTFKNSPTLED